MERTNGLRFVNRDGKMILQQRWVLRLYGDDKSEWHDVPVLLETSYPYAGPHPASQPHKGD